MVRKNLHIFFQNSISCHKTVVEGGFMTYIIEDANVLKEDKLERISLLIKDERFHSLRSTFKRFTHMRVNANSFIMTKPHILFSPQIPEDASFPMMKQYYIEEFLNKGCTMFLTYVEVEKEHLLKPILNKMKTRLLNSPIDYCIGVRIQPKLLTPSFLRNCRREKVPAIFVEVEDDEMLERLPWGWLREAMFPYNSPLIPIFKADKARMKNRAKLRWTSLLYEEKIPFIEDELVPYGPISHLHLCKMGIYPLKSGIHQGGEVSYNFYAKEDMGNNIMEEELFQKYNDRLKVTVHKGTVIRAGLDVLFRPGFGEHVVINTPNFFIME